MKSYYKSLFILLLIQNFTFCIKKPLEIVEEVPILTEDSFSDTIIISDTKRNSDSTKIAFGEIEFNMTLSELIQTKHYKNISEKDIYNTSFHTSYTFSDKFEKCGMSEYILLDKQVLNRDDVVEIKTVDKIGLYEYDIVANLYRDSLYMVVIELSEDNMLKNLIDVISSKYKITKKYKKKDLEYTKKAKDELSKMTEQDHMINALTWGGKGTSVDDYKHIPQPYMLYLWKLNNDKNICVYHVYNTFQNLKDPRVYQVSSKYLVEIYNDNILNNIITYFRESLKIIEDKNEMIKVKDASKF